MYLKSIISHCVGHIMISMIIFFNAGTVSANFDSFAEPNPLSIQRDAEIMRQSGTDSRALGPSVEWEYHKTSDNRHPNGNEQQLMWLMNRARSNPIVEGIWFATIHERYYPDINACSRLADDIDLCKKTRHPVSLVMRNRISKLFFHTRSSTFRGCGRLV